MSSIYIWSENSRPKAEIDVQCQSLSIVFSCFDVDLKKNTVVL